MYLPGQNFTGLGSKLDKRLNSNGTPKVWSKLVNRVDGVAYRHNLAYAKYSNTAKRIVANNKTLKELDSITRQTFKERMERAIVKPRLNTEVKFGV